MGANLKAESKLDMGPVILHLMLPDVDPLVQFAEVCEGVHNNKVQELPKAVGLRGSPNQEKDKASHGELSSRQIRQHHRG